MRIGIDPRLPFVTQSPRGPKGLPYKVQCLRRYWDPTLPNPTVYRVRRPRTTVVSVVKDSQLSWCMKPPTPRQRVGKATWSALSCAVNFRNPSCRPSRSNPEGDRDDLGFFPSPIACLPACLQRGDEMGPVRDTVVGRVRRVPRAMRKTNPPWQALFTVPMVRPPVPSDKR